MSTLDDDHHDPAKYLTILAKVAAVTSVLFTIGIFYLQLTCHCSPPARVGEWLYSVTRT